MNPQVCTELKYSFLKITRNIQSSFRISFADMVAYIDPFKITEENHDADYIFITHEHKDHFDLESINKIKKESTIFITNHLVAEQLITLVDESEALIELKPNDHLDLDKFISLDTKPAYNIDKFREPGKLYHPKENDGLGFVITFQNAGEKVKTYHMGDTDFLPEYQIVEELDILMIPVGGKYVMNKTEAIEANGQIKPLISVPMHYDSATGNVHDAEDFINNITNQGVIL